jgi:hypothetical protein
MAKLVYYVVEKFGNEKAIEFLRRVSRLNSQRKLEVNRLLGGSIRSTSGFSNLRDRLVFYSYCGLG